MRHNQTKKQTKNSGKSSINAGIIIGSIVSIVIIGFIYWDYREQVKFYNIWERGTGLDFKTGKVDPNYKPPPFKYRYEGITSILPFILIGGGVSLMMLLFGVYELRTSQKIVETDAMRALDAKQAAKENTPEFKRYARDKLILQLAPYVLLIPVPFIAMYGLGAVVFAVYIIFVALVVGALYVFLPRKT